MSTFAFGKTTAGTLTGTLSGARAMGGTLPATAGMVLDSISIHFEGAGAATRAAVYAGGSLTDPSGAALIHDFGVVTAYQAGWNTFAAPANRSLPSGSVVWLAVNGNNFAWTVYFDDSSVAGYSGDWQPTRGRYLSAVIADGNATVWPATWPADTGSFGTTYYSMYLTYSTGPTNTAPTVTITSPTAEAVTVPSGTRLQVLATAFDQHGTDISQSITWSSNDAGDVPAGGWPAGGTLIIDTTGWVNGQRTITANVTDAGGLQATQDSFTLTIGAGPTLILEDDVQQEIMQSGVAATVRVALRDSTGAVLESNPLAPGDVKKSVDGGAAAVLAGDAGAAAWTVVNGFLNVPLSAAEVSGGEITLFIEDQDGGAFLDRVVKIMVVGYDPRATPASTTQIAGAVGDALSARLAS